MKPMSERIEDYNRKRAEMEAAMKQATIRTYASEPKQTDEQRWNAMWMYEEER